jgi:hypothetical protein
MKLWRLGLVILVTADYGLAARVPQQEPSEPVEEQPAPQESPRPSLQRPTLGPAPAPTLGGARSSHIGDARRLMAIRKVFIQRIDNNLSEKLAAALRTGGLFRVVDKPAEADAVVRGSCFEARRLRKVHTEIYLVDRSTEKIIWQDVIRQPFNPPPLEKAVDATVAEILAHLRLDIREAPRQSR